MNKISIKKKGLITCLSVKMKKGQELNMREIDLLNSYTYSEFIPVEIRRKQLVYNVSALISLEEVIANYISVDSFFVFVQKIMHLFETLQTAYLYTRNVFLEAKYIYLSPETGGIHVIYCPIINYDYGVEEKQFFLSLIHKVHTRSGQDSVKIAQFQNFLETMNIFSLYESEKFIANLVNSNSEKLKLENLDRTRSCPNCGYPNKEKAKYCCACGADLISERDGIQEQVYIPSFGEMACTNQTGSVNNDPGYTSVLGEADTDETVILQEQIEETPKVYLLRTKTGDRIPITSKEFLVGKDRYNANYYVGDNPAISRKHAMIVLQDGNIYLKDCHSTNGTFIDNKRIAAEQLCDVYPGQKIRMADEEFQLIV